MWAWLRTVLLLRRSPRGTGAEGERLAATWLARERGLRIVARNWRSPRDRRLEIDLVARDGEALVFVEVKTRAANALVPGYFAAVSPGKKQALLRAARDYLGRMRERPRTVRFDVVEVAADEGGVRKGGPAGGVLHFENVPLFPKEFLRGG